MTYRLVAIIAAEIHSGNSHGKKAYVVTSCVVKIVINMFLLFLANRTKIREAGS